MQHLELTDPTPDGCRHFLQEASAMGIRAVEFDCGTWLRDAIGATFTLLYDTGGRRADSLPVQAFATSDTFDEWRRWAGGGKEVPLSEIEVADITGDPDYFSSFFDGPVRELAVCPVDERVIERGFASFGDGHEDKRSLIAALARSLAECDPQRYDALDLGFMSDATGTHEFVTCGDLAWNVSGDSPAAVMGTVSEICRRDTERAMPIEQAERLVGTDPAHEGQFPSRRGGLSVSVTMSPDVIADALGMSVSELDRACHGHVEQVLDAVASDLEEYVLDMCANRDYDVALSASEAIDGLEREER